MVIAFYILNGNHDIFSFFSVIVSNFIFTDSKEPTDTINELQLIDMVTRIPLSRLKKEYVKMNLINQT